MNINEFFSFDERLTRLAEEAEADCQADFRKIEEIAAYNGAKVLAAFQKNRVTEPCFYGSTGYGYGDQGRDVLDRVFADVFGAEDALVRHNFVSGTHALTVALFGILRTGDKMVSITGKPYDTLDEVLGLSGEPGGGSLMDYGVEYSHVELLPDGTPDYDAIEKGVAGAKVAYIQRSRGYSLRPAYTMDQMRKMTEAVRRGNPDAIIMVDNCYGEFVEDTEPTQNGADLMIGSLIKNAGGGIAPTGGYIAGKRALVEMCAYRLTTPGTGKEIGATLGNNRELFMGSYHAPFVSCEALKTAVFASALFEILGYDTTPKYSENRGDIIQLIMLGNEEKLCSFCEGIQSGSAVDSFVKPEPSDMPGYESKVIMAAGAFTLGSSIELSADAPLREPYAVWMQGGLNFPSGKLGIMLAADRILKKSKSK